ncbi:carbohydrate porin [Polynucleobacter parvulilacunae]|uniref:carbohydrate porin n=1 Tax=Polynucleobacter parvulilacunae TaxID=1855631 RepID=UPI001C0DBE8C|nr:carbohydrate porin [Polynucleobacter parvulilacunae]
MADSTSKFNELTLLIEFEDRSLHGQATYITQQRNNFDSPYHGENSLLNKNDGPNHVSYSLSATAYFGQKLWQNAEFYINPEMFEGTSFGNELVGLGGFFNGELQKGTYIPPTYFIGRAFLRQTIGLGGGDIQIQSAKNQLAGIANKNRLVLTYGKFSALDFFDSNAYSSDPRVQFQNFSIASMGAYGYAADNKGFTYGIVSEWHQDDWILKIGRMAMPTSPNTAQLDYTLSKDYVNQFEIAHDLNLLNKAGAIRGLFFQQRGYMANYNDAINNAGVTKSTPDIFNSRYTQNSWGYGFSLEQSINDSIGIFARWSWSPGKTETQTLDISRSLSGGMSVQGEIWSRPKDTLGIGFAINQISSSQISYLGLGGMTMFIGDGNITYKPERVIETYYSAHIYDHLYGSINYQRIENPAYNSARGPINFWGVRAHFEF